MIHESKKIKWIIHALIPLRKCIHCSPPFTVYIFALSLHTVSQVNNEERTVIYSESLNCPFSDAAPLNLTMIINSAEKREKNRSTPQQTSQNPCIRWQNNTDISLNYARFRPSVVAIVVTTTTVLRQTDHRRNARPTIVDSNRHRTQPSRKNQWRHTVYSVYSKSVL